MSYKTKTPLFNGHFHIFVGDAEYKKFREQCVKTFGDDLDRDSIQENTDSKGKCCGSYVWIKTPNLNTFCHEIYHYIDNSLHHFGVDDRSGEVGAYLFGWFIDTVWPKIEKLTPATLTATENNKRSGNERRCVAGTGKTMGHGSEKPGS